MHRFLVVLLQLGIVAAFAAGLFGQIVVVPTTGADEVDQYPPYAPYAVPYESVAIVGIACVQIALIATWMLLALVRRNSIFSPDATRWLNVVIGSAVGGTLLAAGVVVHLFFGSVPSPDDGCTEITGLFGNAVLGTAAGIALVMFLVIVRTLLRKATALQTEMAEVV
ncbi:DUF2975 domain-containing protein [Nocardia sp. BMG111209]|uniref:DUF2975 domain-containing protein n=1 Tax=Nocardia sp. BMG111209 TaxID=1160137 RepID=UPI0003788C8B|nr:DUF2975 domain-containing protein [Nocardia sp. BMG111209]